MQRFSGCYSIKENTNKILQSEDVLSYVDEFVEAYGVCNTNDSFLPYFCKEFELRQFEALDFVNDQFLAIILDKRKKTISICSDVTTSPLNMYFTCVDDKIFYSTSLKDILFFSKVKKELDESSAKSFLANGYVYGKKTLLKNIYKVSFGEAVIFDDKGINWIKAPYSLKKPEKKEALQNLVNVEQKCITDYLGKEKNLHMPLSGGYDSNLIFKTVSEIPGIHIDAYTVGGEAGKSEIGSVEKNIEGCNFVSHHKVKVKKDDFNNYSDIVWRLEGSVFETGVFLQYALAKAAAENGAKKLLCGESSDEVQNCYYSESLKRVLEHQIKEDEKLSCFSDPFIETNMIILKKSSLMLNSFGIAGMYPFKDKRFVEYAVAVAKENGTQKEYYKKLCKKLFGNGLQLSTTGGTTDSSILLSDEDVAFFEETCAKSDLAGIFNNQSFYVSKRTRLLKLRQNSERIVRKLKEGGIKAVINRTKSFQANKSADNLLKKIYLLLFYELFVSGRYDSDFTSISCPVKVNDIFRKE